MVLMLCKFEILDTIIILTNIKFQTSLLCLVQFMFQKTTKIILKINTYNLNRYRQIIYKEWEFFSDCSISDHCQCLPFHIHVINYSQ